MSETKTPRSDSEEIKLKSRGNWHGEISVVGSDFSRQLETELAAANERADAYKQVAEAARCIRHWHDSGTDGMIVSASHVHALWRELAKLEALNRIAGGKA